MTITRMHLLAGVAVIQLVIAAPAAAAPQERYDLPRQSLEASLLAVARKHGLEFSAPAAALTGRKAPPLRGTYTAREALGVLLGGTALSAEVTDTGIVVAGRDTPPDPQVTASADDETITVTGTRIRGTETASLTIAQTQQQMRDAGFNTLGDVVRSIPQNFPGSLNPGAGLNVPERSGTSLGGGSSINLRGLGGDATLTLLNGHRLAYNGAFQAIDVSAIPLAALDRIEIVADGASALYGSDAVAGVANILLKRDFNGLNTAARFGASTDGGNVQQQYSLVGGDVWSTGGVMLAFDYARDTPILARQRGYAATRAPGLTLYPGQTRRNVVLTAHQTLADGVVLAVDGLYNHRRSQNGYAFDAAGDPTTSGGIVTARNRSFALAPSLSVDLPGGWRTELSGVYARDRTRYGIAEAFGGLSFATRGCYCNDAWSTELSADGPVFALPGGDAKAALGGGYRENGFHAFRTVGSAQDIDVRQGTWLAFGELNLPLVGRAQGVPFIDSLTLSAALRHEHYPSIDSVTTPKLGAVYAPTPDVAIKASWGKSFRAPTLYQQYSVQSTQLASAASYGGASYPAGATALLVSGGNPALAPERATTWSAAFVVEPRALPDARLEISYFNVRYHDRIVAPIGFTGRALSDPALAAFVALDPTDAEKAAVTSDPSTFFNYTGAAYDPASVVAIIRNTNFNAARQTAEGVDVLATYRFALAGGTLDLTANSSYIDTHQRLSDLQPERALAGTIFNPPHVRGRLGLSWQQDGFAFTANLNHASALKDRRSDDVDRLAPMTTLDLNVRQAIESGPFAGVTITLGAINILNEKPDVLGTTQVYEAPYDSINGSPVGRFVSLAISKQW